MSLPRTVFVIGDDPDISGIVRHVCATLDMAALAFTSVSEVMAAPEQADIILLDMELGDGNGVDVLRGLAAHRSTAAIYLMSGQDSRLLKTVRRLGHSYGLSVQGILLKPLALADLEAVLQAPIDLDESSLAPMSRGPELHRAILRGDLRVFFQPKVDIRTRAVNGCEALVRWEHPDRGLLSPAEFLPTAEQFDLMRSLTRWVMDAALAQMSKWRAQGHGLGVSVNVSADLLTDLTLPNLIRAKLDRHGLNSSDLTLEVTESAAVRSLQTAVDVLTRLRLMQMSLSIDDFGTGHASIVKLRQLPFNELKIDRSFVQDLTVDSDARVLVGAMIAIGHSFGMRMVGEGVESEEELAVLSELGCETAQGYLIGRPMPADRFMAWLGANDPNRTSPTPAALRA